VRLRWHRPANTVLAKNTIRVGLGQALQVGTQVVYFVLIARALGSREYGAFVSVVAVVALAAPFASLGSGNLLIKHVSRNSSTFARHWGKAVATTLLMGTILLGIVIIVARVWLPTSIPLRLVLAVGASDLLFVRLLDVSAQAYQAHQRLSWTAFLQLVLSPLRLLAAFVLITIAPVPSALEWGMAYLVSAVVGAGVGIVLVNRELGWPEFHLRHIGLDLREGVFFSLSLSAQNSLNDSDKAILARLATLEATGVYAAAWRLAMAVFLPVGSLQVATYARFFQHGAHGVRASARLALRILPLGACYGVLAAAALYFLAPLVPAILGSEYHQAIAAIRWLAIVPLLRAVHYFAGDALTGAGYQWVKTIIHVSIAVVNVLLNLWLVPLYSWRGAAVATVVSDVLMGVAIWTALWYLGRHGRRIPSPQDVPSVMELG
jgi:O-antigen/teichoic acid export membrane protein